MEMLFVVVPLLIYFMWSDWLFHKQTSAEIKALLEELERWKMKYEISQKKFIVEETKE